jgi:hypothetical protein
VCFCLGSHDFLTCDVSLKGTRFAFQPKLLLIRIASSMGAFSYVKELYGLLDIKYVQQDSMGHYALYPAVQSGDVAWVSGGSLQPCMSH